jgi:hypothetical protein
VQPDADPTTKKVDYTDRTTEFKRVEPDVAPVFKPNTTIQNQDGTTTTLDTTTTAGEETPWRAQFVAPITTGQVGAWETGQARADAKKWRDLHMRAAKKKWGYGTDEFNKQAYIDQRNRIATRHRKMLGAGPKTLKDGTVLEY